MREFWTRNSYFAAFETAALVGAIRLLEAHHKLAACVSGLGILLTTLWYLSNDRLQEYIRFWWDKMIEIEESNAAHQPDLYRTSLRLAADFSRWRSVRQNHRPHWPWRYSSLVQVIPGLFQILWFTLLWIGLMK